MEINKLSVNLDDRQENAFLDIGKERIVSTDVRAIASLLEVMSDARIRVRNLSCVTRRSYTIKQVGGAGIFA